MDQITLFRDSEGIPERTPASYHGQARITQYCVVDGRPFLIAPGLAKRYTVCSDECKRARLSKPILDTKRCSKCLEEKPVEDFYVTGSTGRPFSHCKKCCADDQREQIERKRESDLASTPGGIPDRTPPGYRSTKRIQKTCVAYLKDRGEFCGQAFLIATSIAHKYSTCSLEHTKLRAVKPIGKTRVCTKCTREQPIDRFYRLKQRGGRPMAWCIDCCAKRDAQERRKRPGAHLTAGRNYRRRKMLGLTREEYEALKATLREDCAACGATEKLCADHDHLTGWFRDILCQTDNRIIGLVKEDSARLRRLADYIDLHRARHAAASGKEDIYPVPAEGSVPETMRRCPQCRVPKLLDEFKGGYCIPCRTQYMRIYMRAKRLGVTVKEYEAQHPDEMAKLRVPAA